VQWHTSIDTSTHPIPACIIQSIAIATAAHPIPYHSNPASLTQARHYSPSHVGKARVAVDLSLNVDRGGSERGDGKIAWRIDEHGA